jgi:hypothetical protein
VIAESTSNKTGLCDWHAFGHFVKQGKSTFRTEAELRNGEGRRKIIGAVVMQNPGDAKPFGKTYDEMTECTMDKTMEWTCNRIEGAYELAEMTIPKGAVVRIFNLFNYRAQKKEAIDWAKKQKDVSDDVLFTKPTPELFEPGRWVWLAWGGESLKLLDALREEWLSAIRKGQSRRIGIPKPGSPKYYYHPRFFNFNREERGFMERTFAKVLVEMKSASK